MLRPLLFGFSLLFAPAVAAAQSIDDQVIVPGVRIGPWRLAMTVDDLIKLNGPEVGRGLVTGFPDVVRPFTLLRWPTLGFGVATLDGNQILFLALGIGGVPIPHKTAEGIGFRSTAAEVLKVYGNPTAETVPRAGQANLIYDELGINFQVIVNGRVQEVRLFRPGTASSIWRLR